ncbi:uncharacterized protein BYT42DRAFT_556458 [Radiomyces spectabilis]|uniref:uncharacterized protein n=1 Tax=Radiomyces spectabilis TaxID=64574 RepID=UPI0022207DE0|nr:uncharacterized protein BYT42DRAFT_556458 [Radiomyces spectabilis]KAI8391311.1 hypothetical protein BYT42DRAFT_556458 [Radiomyces spectabilis]
MFKLFSHKKKKKSNVHKSLNHSQVYTANDVTVPTTVIPRISKSTETRPSTHQHPLNTLVSNKSDGDLLRSQARPISSPPSLVMPKPRHALPPTRAVLRNYDNEKTEIEEPPQDTTGASQEDWSEDDEVFIVEWVPKQPTPTSTQEHIEVSPIMLPPQQNNNIIEVSAQPAPSASVPSAVSHRSDTTLDMSQQPTSVTSSDDSHRVYESALESPLASVSSSQSQVSMLVQSFSQDPSLSLSAQPSPYVEDECIELRPSVLEKRVTPPSPVVQQLRNLSGNEAKPALIHPQLVESTVHANTPKDMNPLSSGQYYRLQQQPTARSTSSSTSSMTIGATSHRASTKSHLPAESKVSGQNSARSSPAPSKGPPPCWNEDLEDIQRQLQFIQEQRRAEREEWNKREIEHQRREQAMMEQIHRTQEQLMQALAQTTVADNDIARDPVLDDTYHSDTSSSSSPYPPSRSSRRSHWQDRKPPHMDHGPGVGFERPRSTTSQRSRLSARSWRDREDTGPDIDKEPDDMNEYYMYDTGIPLESSLPRHQPRSRENSLIDEPFMQNRDGAPSRNSSIGSSSRLHQRRPSLAASASTRTRSRSVETPWKTKQETMPEELLYSSPRRREPRRPPSLRSRSVERMRATSDLPSRNRRFASPRFRNRAHHDYYPDQYYRGYHPAGRFMTPEEEEHHWMRAAAAAAANGWPPLMYPPPPPPSMPFM